MSIDGRLDRAEAVLAPEAAEEALAAAWREAWGAVLDRLGGQLGSAPGDLAGRFLDGIREERQHFGSEAAPWWLHDLRNGMSRLPGLPPGVAAELFGTLLGGRGPTDIYLQVCDDCGLARPRRRRWEVPPGGGVSVPVEGPLDLYAACPACGSAARSGADPGGRHPKPWHALPDGHVRAALEWCRQADGRAGEGDDGDDGDDYVGGDA